jgi:hypothetical protein
MGIHYKACQRQTERTKELYEEEDIIIIIIIIIIIMYFWVHLLARHTSSLLQKS